MHINYAKLCQFVLQIFSGNEIRMGGIIDGQADGLKE